MDANKKTARIGGLLYLAVILSGIFDLVYVPNKLVMQGDSGATLTNIVASETLFRLGILSGLMSNIFFLLLPLALYKLLKEVNKTNALLMVALSVVSIPISLTIIISKLEILSLIHNVEYLKVCGMDKLRVQVSLYLDFYNKGNLIAEIFWGLWLFPFGYLVFKSGFLPKFLGILLMIGCFSYLINFMWTLLFSNYGKTGISTFIVTLPASMGEIGTCLWLLIFGIKSKRTG